MATVHERVIASSEVFDQAPVAEVPAVPRPDLPVPVWDHYQYPNTEGTMEMQHRVSFVEGEGETRRVFDFQDNIEGMDLANPAHRDYVAAHLGIFLEKTFGSGVTDVVRFAQPVDKTFLGLNRDQHVSNNTIPWGKPSEIGIYIDVVSHPIKENSGKHKSQFLQSMRGLEHLGSSDTYLDIQATLPAPSQG